MISYTEICNLEAALTQAGAACDEADRLCCRRAEAKAEHGFNLASDRLRDTQREFLRQRPRTAADLAQYAAVLRSLESVEYDSEYELDAMAVSWLGPDTD